MSNNAKQEEMRLPEQSRTERLLYWIPTGLVFAVMLSGGIVDAMGTESALEVTRRLGYPDYFTVMLGVAKVLGALALLAPVPRTLREWAYAGFTFDVTAAIASLIAVGEATHIAIPVVALGLVLLSFRGWRRRAPVAVVTTSGHVAAPAGA